MLKIDQKAVPLCPHCISPVGPFDHLCPRCGGPVTAHASNDPVSQILSTGRAYRNAISLASRPIVFMGVWLIFGPQALMLLILFILWLWTSITQLGGSWANHSVTVEAPGLLLMVALLAIYTVIL